MAKRQKADAADTGGPHQLQTKSAQDARHLMASVVAIKQEWHDAAAQISQLYKQHRQDSPVGRRAILDDASAVASILAAIDSGLTPQQAGNAIGISPQCIDRLLAQGEKDAAVEAYSAHRLFRDATQMAKDRRRQRLLQRIEAAGEAGPQFWTAPAWLLERGYGQDYKLQQVTGTGGVTVNIGVMAREDVTIGVITPTTGAHNALADVVIPVTHDIAST